MSKTWAIQEEARKIMQQKGSYEPTASDPRVIAEYERAYTFIQQIASGWLSSAMSLAAGEHGDEQK